MKTSEKAANVKKHKNNLKDLQRTQDHVTNDKKVCSMETKQKEIMGGSGHRTTQNQHLI